jgi:hypothetical protein
MSVENIILRSIFCLKGSTDYGATSESEKGITANIETLAADTPSAGQETVMVGLRCYSAATIWYIQVVWDGTDYFIRAGYEGGVVEEYTLISGEEGLSIIVGIRLQRDSSNNIYAAWHKNDDIVNVWRWGTDDPGNILLGSDGGAFTTELYTGTDDPLNTVTANIDSFSSGQSDIAWGVDCVEGDTNITAEIGLFSRVDFDGQHYNQVVSNIGIESSVDFSVTPSAEASAKIGLDSVVDFSTPASFTASCAFCPCCTVDFMESPIMDISGKIGIRCNVAIASDRQRFSVGATIGIAGNVAVESSSRDCSIQPFITRGSLL